MEEILSLDLVRDRVVSVLTKEFGRVEEDLVGSGLLDSLKSISAALLLEEEFALPLTDELSMVDMATVLLLSKKIYGILTANVVELVDG
jgi:hypothetical protein